MAAHHGARHVVDDVYPARVHLILVFLSLFFFLPPFSIKMIYGGRVPIQFELASRDMTGDDEGAELEPFYVRLVVA